MKILLVVCLGGENKMSMPKYMMIVPDGFVKDEQGNKWAKFKLKIKWWGYPILFVKKLVIKCLNL